MHLAEGTRKSGSEGGKGSGLPAASARVGHQEGIPAASSPGAGKLLVARETWVLVPQTSGQGSLLTCCDGHSYVRQYMYWHS